ncbi:carbonic anhydrase [Leifsonia sp. 563]|uniref:beta-class carbonic anhydrase n=1 Tax=Leifsonia sp. 563 TaxID=3156412 RepID=UPI00339A795C
MSITDDALRANATLAGDYDPAGAGPPAPKIAIVTCADPRLSGVVRLMGLADADVDLIRNVGTVIDDDAMRSLIVSTRMLGTREILVINHDDCGLSRFSGDDLVERLRAETGRYPIAPAQFFTFTDAERNTREQVLKVRSHPWISPDVPVRGFVFGVRTGRLTEVLVEDPVVPAAG